MSPRKAPIQYLAGYFDGEACITMMLDILAVVIVSSDLDILQQFDLRFGGGCRKKTHTRMDRIQLYQWRLNGFKSLPALRQLAPYLIAKREQAEAALGYGHVPTQELRQKLRGFKDSKLKAKSADTPEVA